MFSSFLRRSIALPFDEDACEQKLQELIKNSKFQKAEGNVDNVDMEASFN